MPENGIWGLLMQVPLTGAVIWFVMWLRKNERAEREANDKATEARLAKIMDAHEKALDKIGSRVSDMADQLQRLAVILILHDSAIRRSIGGGGADSQEVLRMLDALGHPVRDLKESLNEV